MTFNASGGNGVASKLSLCLLHFILAVSSGWALKHFSNSCFTLAAYGLFFAHSLFCILRHTHPNPGYVQRSICERSRRYVPVIFITLIIGELLSIKTDTDLSALWWAASLGLYTTVLALALIKRCFSKISILARIQYALLDLCVLWNVFCLCRIAYSEELYWVLGLALLVLLNNFVLWRLTLHFKISKLEVGTVGMCFSVLFAINATQEILEMKASPISIR